MPIPFYFEEPFARRAAQIAWAANPPRMTMVRPQDIPMNGVGSMVRAPVAVAVLLLALVRIVHIMTRPERVQE